MILPILLRKIFCVNLPPYDLHEAEDVQRAKDMGRQVVTAIH